MGSVGYNPTYAIGVLIMIGEELDAAMAEREPLRPLRDMILLLPHINARKVGSEFHLDWESAAPELLTQLARVAEITQRTVNRGVSAIGRLLVAVSPECGLGEIPSDYVESIGWILAELGDLGCTSTDILTACQRYTSDYSPSPPPKRIPTARP